MKNLNNWLVELSDTDVNSAYLKNIFDLANKIRPENIDFLFVARKVELPADIQSEFPDLQQVELRSVTEKFKEVIASKIDESINFKIDARIGDTLKELLIYSEENSSELITLANSKGDKYFNKKVVRKASSHVLIVPEKELLIDSVLMPVDFSEHTDRAVELARIVVESLSVKNVQAKHFYKDASHYVNHVIESPFEVGSLMKERNDLDNKLKLYAEHRMIKFSTEHAQQLQGLTVTCEKVVKGNDTREQINATIKNSKAEMVIMGSKGASDSSSTILGSVTESVEFSDYNKYFLIAKKENENKSLLKSLLSFASL